ncbi:MAG: hypothetical protein ACXIVE_00580 [Salinarimonas sp.]
MGHSSLRSESPLRLLARFAYEHGIGRVREIASLLDLSQMEFSRLRRDEGWRKRDCATPSWRLGPFLASYDAHSAEGVADSEEVSSHTADIAGALRRFIAHRLLELSATQANPRDLTDLTRCLKELSILEDKLARRAQEDEKARREREGGDETALAGGTASDLAEIVALEVERLHERHGTGGALGALYPADAPDSGSELGADGA